MIFFLSILGILTLVYVCSIAWLVFGFKKIQKEGIIKQINKIENKVSVLIPVRNEENSIIQCLVSLQNQNFKVDNFEVLVINDHSTDKTEELVNLFIKNSKLNIIYFSLTSNTTKKEALKFGIEKCEFDIIATTDGDCVLPENWLSSISNNIREDTDMLLGPINFKKQTGLLSGFQSLDMFALQGLEFGALGYNKPILNNAANLAYLKKSYKDVDGFDKFQTPSGDDVFLLEKFEAKDKCVRGLLSSTFIVETESENTFKGFFNQRLRWSSKSKYYTNKLLLFFSFIILLENLSLLFIYFGIPFVEKFKSYLIFLLFSKWLIDFILLFLVADFFKQRRMLFYFIPVQILYPIYIVVIWIASMFMKFEWKERKFNE